MGELGCQGGGEALEVEGRLVLIAHAEAAADVDVADVDALPGQTALQFQQPFQCGGKRGCVGDLGADVAVHSHHVQRVRLRGAGV